MTGEQLTMGFPVAHASPAPTAPATPAASKPGRVKWRATWPRLTDPQAWALACMHWEGKPAEACGRGGTLFKLRELGYLDATFKITPEGRRRVTSEPLYPQLNPARKHAD